MFPSTHHLCQPKFNVGLPSRLQVADFIFTMANNSQDLAMDKEASSY